MLNSIKGGSWLACDGINPVYLTHRGACIAGKPAPTERQSSAALADERGQSQLPQKSKSSAVVAVCTRSNCGSGLAREGGWSVTHELTEPPPSRASPLPHFDLSASDRDVLLCS